MGKSTASSQILTLFLIFLVGLLLSLPASTQQLYSGTDPAMPIRGVGINEGFADLSGYSLGQPTVTTVDDIAARGYRIVKIWPIDADPVQLSLVFTDPRLDVIIYRPLHNSQQEVACGLASFYWEDVDYGQVATQLYNLYGDENKTIILTGWEADNQIKTLPRSNPSCGWPSQSQVDWYRDMLNARQVGIRAARNANAFRSLRIYHAVEVRSVPDIPSGGNNVLEKIIPQMTEQPDFISYSAWGGTPAKIVTKLNVIESVSGISPRERIFVGEWGCRVSNGNRTNCFQGHATNAFNWGIRLWNVWVYSGPGGSHSYDLLDGATGLDTPNGFSVLDAINTTWYKKFPVLWYR